MLEESKVFLSRINGLLLKTPKWLILTQIFRLRILTNRINKQKIQAAAEKTKSPAIRCEKFSLRFHNHPSKKIKHKLLIDQ